MNVVCVGVGVENGVDLGDPRPKRLRPEIGAGVNEYRAYRLQRIIAVTAGRAIRLLKLDIALQRSLVFLSFSECTPHSGTLVWERR